MINLAEVETRTQEQAAGATTPDPATIKGMIVKQAWYLEKEGRKESTIKFRNRLLNTLMKRGGDLLDPESIKGIIAKMKCDNGTKLQYTVAYDVFASVNGIKWNRPDYKQTDKYPFIPTEADLDQLIAACQRKTATFLQLLKETRMRPGEACRLTWVDIDFERKLITLNTPEKGSNAGVFKISVKMIDMLKALPKQSERIWPWNPKNKSGQFCSLRKRIAARLQNPRILKITFKTFRHWKGTMLAHQTKDPFYVQNFLRHKNILSTQKYIHLEKLLFDQQSDEFNAKVAKNVEDACKLVEVGFEYVTTIEGVQIFRKRK
jgi:integrase